MANSDKNISIVPNTSTTNTPQIVFTGQNNSPITLKILDDGSLSFEGSNGQLFSISNSFAGTLFNVNDISGIPSFDVEDTGRVRVAPFNGNVIIGASAVDTTTAGGSSTDTLQVTGNTFINGTLVLAGLPEHDTEAAATTAGLAAGSVYQTSTGELRIKL